MPLLERDALLGALDVLLASATAANGSLVLLGGEAGAGKTSLVREFASRAGSRAVVLFGACDPLTTPRPLSPLIDISLDPRAALPNLIAGRGEPTAIFTAVLERLRTARPPIVLVVEDIHWADEGTLDFIRFVGRRAANLRALIVCTYRDDEVGADHPARLVLGDLATRPTTHRLKVPSLSVAAVRQLSGLAGARAEELHRITAGNAFYVTEIVTAGVSLPGSVQDAVLSRIGRLGGQAKRLVESVATAPRDLEVDYALTASGVSTAEVDEALSAGVLVVSEGRLRFRHELARDAALAAIPLGRRIELHRSMIDLLLNDRPDDLARLAHHAGHAHAWDLVARFAPEAARQASARGARREAVQFLKLALARADQFDSASEAALRESLAAELSILDRHSEALAQRELAVARRREIGDSGALAKALLVLSGSQWATGDHQASQRSLAEAERVVAGVEPGADLAFALSYFCYDAMLRRQYRPAVEAGERAIAMAREFGLGRIVTSVTINLGAAELVMGDPARGVAMLREVINGSNPLTDRAHALAQWMLGSGGGEARVYDVAVEALNAVVELGLRSDDDYGVAYSRAWLARIAFEQARWDDVARFAALVETDGGRGLIGPITALGALGRAKVRRGDPDAAVTLLRTLEIGRGAAMQYLWSPYCGLAELAWLEGRSEEIPEILSGIGQQAFASDSPWARGEIGFWLWRVGRLEGPPLGVAAPFAALCAGDWRRAARLWAEFGCPYDRAVALGEGDKTSMLEALAVFDRLGARPAAARLRAKLRAAGVETVPRGPRQQTMLNPVGLTARQVAVLELMVAGLSNSEIADRLSITTKTTEHHVSAVLSKLGAATRARAVAKALALGLFQGPGRHSPA